MRWQCESLWYEIKKYEIIIFTRFIQRIFSLSLNKIIGSAEANASKILAQGITYPKIVSSEVWTRVSDPESNALATSPTRLMRRHEMPYIYKAELRAGWSLYTTLLIKIKLWICCAIRESVCSMMGGRRYSHQMLAYSSSKNFFINWNLP